MITKTERLQKANELIRVISSCGREFFRHKNNISYFELNKYNRLYFRDKYTDTRLPCWHDQENYKYNSHKWNVEFTEGGTLKYLVKDLATYIMIGEEIGRHHFNWPKWYCERDNIWGYPKEDMDKVRKFYQENF